MRNKIRYILLTAQRDSLFVGLALAIALACALGVFLGSNAVSESTEMSLVYAAGASRIVLITGLIIFTAFSIRRFFENREIDLMLVRPVSREKFIFAFWLGFSMVALCFVLITSAILYLMAAPDLYGFLIWSFSLFLEALVILALTMAASLILKSAVSAVMLSLGFYVLSRMAGFIMLLVTKPGTQSELDQGFYYFSSLIPRLDFFGKTEWLVYGIQDPVQIQLFVLQAVIYIALLLAISIFDFKRKEF